MNRWTAYTFGNGKTAKNRVVVPPMASQTADVNGFATAKTWKHYENLEGSGAGIIFVEYSYIKKNGKGEPNQLGVNLDEQIPGLKKISSIIKKNGALAGIQIVHVGGKSQTTLTGSSLIGPSSIPIPSKGVELETPKTADLKTIDSLVTWYLESGHRAKKSGFDIIELHAAHGYGLNQWLSPITNQRSDIYGGDIIGRSLLLRRIASEFKKYFPELLLAVRLPAQDHFTDGLNHKETAWVSHELENIGVDLIDVSSGIGGWRRPRGINGQGYLIDDASFIKSNINLPVIGVGGITTGEFIDEAIFNQEIDFAAVGRAVLENPDGWYEKNLASLPTEMEMAL